MLTKPKKEISIIIATYNAGKTLERCLHSLIKQKTNEIELLIIDGGSKDTTLSILYNHKQDIDFSISEPDKGIYDAWNKGMKHATGNWIMFVGADDYLMDGAIHTYIDFLKNNDTTNIDLISGKYQYIDTQGKLIAIYGQPYNFNIFKKYMNISHGTSLHNKKLFEEVGGFDLNYKICADYELLSRKKLNTLFINKPLLCMQVGGMSFSIKGLKETYKIRKQYHYISSLTNIFYFIKGSIGYYIKKRFLGFK